MINSDKNVYIQETEIKPNKYATIVLIATLFAILISWFLNEIGIFRVGKTEMRIGSVIPLIAVLIPLVAFLADKKKLADHRSKYVVMAMSIVVTLTVTTLLMFHTVILLLYPIFIAMLYRSQKVGKVALIGSLACTALSPVLCYVLGVWETDFLRELMVIGTNGTLVIEGAYPAITVASIAKILLYMVLPRLLIVGSCALLMFYVIKLGSVHVENQIALNYISHRDALTGLYNQNFFKDILALESDGCPVGVIFLDVNGLKDANDSRGHEYGDLLLKRCAKSIGDVCTADDESAFRLGGDEFIIIIENATEERVLRKIEEWKASIRAVNEENEKQHKGLECSMALGYAMGKMDNLRNLVNEADAKMYKNKMAEKARQKEGQ